MARRRIIIDWKVFDELCGVQCTLDELASRFDCSVDTIERAVQREKLTSFAEYYAQKSNGGKISLRRKMFQLAMQGDRTMLIWLSKQLLGYSEKQEQKLQVENISKEDQNKRLEELHEQVRTMLLDQPQLQELKECQDGSNLPSLLGQTLSPSVSSMVPSKLK